MMFEIFWIFPRGAFSAPESGQHLIELLTSKEFSKDWERYDLNGQRAWVDFDVTSAVRDADAAGTTMMRFSAKDGCQIMLTMGKRGEPPTLIARGDFEPDQVQVLLLASLGGPLPIVRCGAGPVAARAAFFRSGKGLANVAGLDLPCAWVSILDEALSFDPARLSPLGVTFEQRGEHWMFQLLPDPALDPEKCVDRWRDIADAIIAPLAPIAPSLS